MRHYVGTREYFVALQEKLKRQLNIDHEYNFLKKTFDESNLSNLKNLPDEKNFFIQGCHFPYPLQFYLTNDNIDKSTVSNVLPPNTDISGFETLLKWLGNIGALKLKDHIYGNDVFMWDVANGNNSDRLEFLLKCGCTYNNIDKEGKTPLHLMILKNRLYPSSDPNKNQLECFNFIVNDSIRNENFSYLNKKDMFGNTALHYACAHQNLDVVQKLINAGADINIKNKSGQTPYDILNLDISMGHKMVLRGMSLDDNNMKTIDFVSQHNHEQKKHILSKMKIENAEQSWKCNIL